MSAVLRGELLRRDVIFLFRGGVVRLGVGAGFSLDFLTALDGGNLGLGFQVLNLDSLGFNVGDGEVGVEDGLDTGAKGGVHSAEDTTFDGVGVGLGVELGGFGANVLDVVLAFAAALGEGLPFHVAGFVEDGGKKCSFHFCHE